MHFLSSLLARMPLLLGSMLLQFLCGLCASSILLLLLLLVLLLLLLLLLLHRLISHLLGILPIFRKFNYSSSSSSSSPPPPPTQANFPLTRDSSNLQKVHLFLSDVGSVLLSLVSFFLLPLGTFLFSLSSD